ncbi:MAG: hypothetical protein A2Z94_03635 [Gallionellales bacterium GWA2_55_18]|nr:MAG: hypothetical protein A2Z94_03635 [Gallionellales bacterium GWA2_55_18]
MFISYGLFMCGIAQFRLLPALRQHQIRCRRKSIFQSEFLAFGIQKAIHRAYDNTAGLIVKANALIAFIGVDDKIFIAH